MSTASKYLKAAIYLVIAGVQTTGASFRIDNFVVQMN